MQNWMDISLKVDETLAVWPGDPPFSRSIAASIAGGASCNVSRLFMGSHLGTHVDAPYHFIEDGARLDEVALDVFIGDAYVVDASDVKTGQILPEHLGDLPKDVQRVLIKTRNSVWMGQGPFRTDYCALSPQAAQLLVDVGVKLIGIDAFSIAPYDDTITVHHIVLGAGVCALEAITLRDIKAGWYQLMCLPLHIVGADGAPARAVLQMK